MKRSTLLFYSLTALIISFQMNSSSGSGATPIAWTGSAAALSASSGNASAFGPLLYSTLDSAAAVMSPTIGTGSGAAVSSTVLNDFVAGSVGKGARIDSQNEFVRFTQVSNGTKNIDLSQGTIQFWFKPMFWHTNGRRHVLVSTGAWLTPGSLHLVKEDGSAANALTIYFFDLTGARREQSVPAATYSLIPGVWTDIQLSWDFTAPAGVQNIHVFFNSQELSINNPTTGPSAMPAESSTNHIYLGNRGIAENAPGMGVYDEFKILGSAASTTPPPVPPPPAPVDTTPPSIPTGVIATAMSSSIIEVRWSPATDDTGVAGYRVIRDGVEITKMAALTRYNDTSTTAGRTYTYAITAYDAAGNVSAQSLTASASTPSAIAARTVLEMSTLLGGNDFEHSRDVAVDSAGNFYVVGGTTSANFRVTTSIRNSGMPESSFVDPMDIFVMKFGPKGNLIWSTLVGGPNYERAYSVEVDRAGYVYVGGRAGRNAPITPGAFQPTFSGGQEAPFYGEQDGYVFKLSPDGRSLVWASYFGGPDSSIIRDIAVDSNGDIYLASMNSAGSSYPSAVSRAFLNSPLGGGDAVIAKVAADGRSILWARFLGGSGAEHKSAPSVRLDALDQPYFLTLTSSTNAYTSANAYSRVQKGAPDFYLVKLDTSGGILFATYLGGSAAEGTETHNLALDTAGNAYIGGSSCSTNFPNFSGAFDSTHNGNGGSGTGGNSNYPCDGVIAKISSDGSKLLASTYLGGRYGEAVEGIEVDNAGTVHVTGATFSPNFPVTPDALYTTHMGTKDIFYARLSADLSQLHYSTYFGAINASGRGIAVDSAGGAYLVGETNSPIFHTVNAFQPSYGGGNADAFLILFRTQ